tara:strand:- start:247 stop:705 length:459 start_codon:yes stop_codon:yes gene_type:complete
MRKIIFLLTIALLITACPKQRPIIYGPYQAIRCGINRKESHQETFIFNSKNGYLSYLDIKKNEFKPISQRVHKGIYFHSMEELSSRLKVNKLIGNQLIIIIIDNLNQESIINKTINLRWLKMNTVSKKNSKKISSHIDNCMWVDPKKVNTSF